MTYIVSSGTLNPTIPYHTYRFAADRSLRSFRPWFGITTECARII